MNYRFFSSQNRKTRRLLIALALITASSPLGKQSFAASTTLETLHRFTDGSDGAFPAGSLVIDASGALYGTASRGGVGGYGVVFKMTPPAAGKTSWTETVLHSFGDMKYGQLPVDRLIMDRSGGLYGFTAAGGDVYKSCPGGCGIIFKIAPSSADKSVWTESVLHRFTPSEYSPQGLAMDSFGVLYGITAGVSSGSRGRGSVFKLAPPIYSGQEWSETTIYRFEGYKDGLYPLSIVAIDKTGALYGTTSLGGASGAGCVFELVPPAQGKTLWTETVLHSFAVNSKTEDGQNPIGKVVIDSAGALYGTTSAGGKHGYGVAFKLTPPDAGKVEWSEIILHNFAGGSDGFGGSSSLTVDESGSIYGTAGAGREAPSSGNHAILFKLLPPVPGSIEWTDVALYRFTGTQGVLPAGGVTIGKSGILYGATYFGQPPGGSPVRYGIVYALTH